MKNRPVWCTATVDVSPMPASETIRVETGPPSKMEIVREVSLLKRCNAAGSEGTTPFFSKNGGEVVKVKLTKR